MRSSRSTRAAFRIDEHLRRLQRFARRHPPANPHTARRMESRHPHLIAAAPWDDQSLYLQVTRGADNKRDRAFPRCVPPTVFACSPRRWSTRPPRNARQRRRGDHRARHPLGALRPQPSSLLANVLARQRRSTPAAPKPS
jgi:D-alanine transaminase